MTDNMLVILLTIPILDTTLELNIYWVHNLPAIPPGHQLAATYQLEGEYFAVDKHGVYVALPHHDMTTRDRHQAPVCKSTKGPTRADPDRQLGGSHHLELDSQCI